MMESAQLISFSFGGTMIKKKWLFLSVSRHRNPLESEKFCREYIRLEKEAITE